MQSMSVIQGIDTEKTKRAKGKGQPVGLLSEQVQDWQRSTKIGIIYVEQYLRCCSVAT